MPLATLSIDLVAKLAQFEAGMDKAGRIAARQAAQIDRAFAAVSNTAKALGAVIGSAFAGVTLGALFRDSVNAIDAFNDLKDATGASIENISALDDIARRTGGTFEDVSSTLVKFNQVLADAQPGSTAAGIFKQLGLSVAELRKLDPAEALQRTAVALDGFADNGDKARVIQELFGKSVREAAPFLKDLAEAGRLNATVTTQQAEEAERFNKELAKLQTNATNFARDITGDLLPALNRWLENLEKIGGFTGAIASRLGIDELGKLESKAATLTAEQQRLMSVVERLAEGVSRETGSDGSLTAMGKRLQTSLDNTRAKLQALRQEAAATSQQIQVLAGTLSPPGQGRRPPNEGGGRIIEPSITVPDTTPKKKKRDEFVGPLLDPGTTAAIERLEGIDTLRIAELRAELEALLTIRKASGGGAVDEAIQRVEEELQKLSPAARQAAEEQERLNRLLAATPSAKLEQDRETMQFLADAFKAGTITAKEFEEAAAAALGNTADEADKAADAFEEFTKEAARNIQDAFGETLFRTAKGQFDSIEELWGDLLLRMASEAAAAQLGKKLFGDGQGDSGWLGALFSAFGSGAGGGAAGSAKGDAFTPAGKVLRFKNGGTIVDRRTRFTFGGGELGEMGEAGPEGILPLQRGPDGRLGVAAHGVGGTVNNYYQTNNVASGVTQAELVRSLQMLRDGLRAEFTQKLQRAGVA
jgi:hypothetical protein